MTSPNFLRQLSPSQKATIRTQLQAELAKREAARKPRPGLVDWVAEQRPAWDRFDYFAPYAAQLEKAIGGELRLCFASPPQHGKTVFTLHALLWTARFLPGFAHAYVTYNDDRAKEVAQLFRVFALELGFHVRGTLARVEVSRDGGPWTSIRFTSVGGPLTGATITGVVVIDDPIKDREEARSAAVRRKLVDWYESVARTRRHPGTSYIVMATRWPGGDLTDYLTKKKGWKYINLKAIAAGAVNDDGIVLDDPLGRRPGEPLWKRKPLEFFKEDMADLFWWASMYQGEPQAQGMRVFAEPGTVGEDGRVIGARTYNSLPTSGYRVAFGVDLAYTAKTSADWSVCIEGWEHNGNLYVVDVIRKQVDAPSFLLTLTACRARHQGATFRFYWAGPEKGSASFIQQKMGRCFKALPASSDKLVRATPVAAAWNAGRVLLPESAPWLDDFVALAASFTGTPGETDDTVDALAALHDQLLSRRSAMASALLGAT